MTTPNRPLPGFRHILLAAAPAPVAVLLQLAVFNLGWRCHDGLPTPLHAVSALALLLAVAAVVFSWRTLQSADAVWRATSASAAAQARFVSLGTTVFAITCVAIVLLSWFLPYLPGCG